VNISGRIPVGEFHGSQPEREGGAAAGVPGHEVFCCLPFDKANFHIATPKLNEKFALCELTHETASAVDSGSQLVKNHRTLPAHEAPY